MSWFDATGLTSLAKSALKEAQRTIDKALDIDENSENILPTPDAPAPSYAQSKGIQEKLKDESENFFASFGLERKKSPLTPANSPVESSSASVGTKDTGTSKSGGSLMVGSLWGSFTGSFFDNNTASKSKDDIGDDDGVCPGDGHDEGAGGGSIVAVQPGPRPSTSMPSFQLDPTPLTPTPSALTPVSKQPRTTSLDEHTTLPSPPSNTLTQMDVDGSGGNDGGGREWGWGWESSIMVMSTDTHNLQGDGEECREASLCDDAIDEEGFASSRLVVGSVDSEGGGLSRQESLTPATIFEDVFYEEHGSSSRDKHTSRETLHSTDDNTSSDVCGAQDEYQNTQDHSPDHCRIRHSSTDNCTIGGDSGTREDCASRRNDRNRRRSCDGKLDSKVSVAAPLHPSTHGENKGSMSQSHFQDARGSLVREEGTMGRSQLETQDPASRRDSEAHTPDSIIILHSDGSSPERDAEGEAAGEARKRLRMDLGGAGAGLRAASPISSPDSIEVLGSSSVVTSPSSIEVLTGVLSSSDSSPTHQDSCSHTLIQDLSPLQPAYPSQFPQPTQPSQPTPQPSQPTPQPTQPTSHPTPQPMQPSQPTPQPTQTSDYIQQPSPHTTAASAVPTTVVRTQPSSQQPGGEDHDGLNTDSAVITQPTTHRLDDTGLCQTDGSGTFSRSRDRLGDTASSITSQGIQESNHSSSHMPVTSQPPVTSHTSSHSRVDTEFPRGLKVATDSVKEWKVDKEREVEEGRGVEDQIEVEKGKGMGSVGVKDESGRTDKCISEEMSWGKMEGSVGSVEETLPSSEGSAKGLETSFDGMEGSSGTMEGSGVVVEGSGVALDVSVESGGSSDTITASLDSSQLTWTGSRGPDMEPGGGGGGVVVEEQSGAVVQCLLEEAMDEEEEEEERVVPGGSSGGSSSPPERERSPSSSERSEALKVGSGHTSGHSSGDEVETTTSSDIEVISSPSLDGSVAGGGVRSTTTTTATAASRVWASAQRGLRSFLNDRSESPASDSSANNGRRPTNEKGEPTLPSSMTASFTSISESEGEPHFLRPGSLATLDPNHIAQGLLTDMFRGHRRNQSNMSETSESSCEAHSSNEMEKLVKRVAQLSEVLEAREAKVLELSQVNAALQDTNLRLKSQVEEFEGGRGGAGEESLREEFTQRLLTMERKFQQALREKEATKKLLEEVRAEAATRMSLVDAAREREERETVIRELREEGEKLSRQQLTYSTMLKKLRVKEKDGEATITAQKEKLEEQSRELERLRRQLGAKEEVERRQVEAVGQLDASRQRLEAEVKRVTQDNAEVTGKMEALKDALDAAYKEVAELQRAAAARDAEAQEQALSAEVGARKQLEVALTEAEEQASRQQQALAAQVAELQHAIAQTHAQADARESQLRQEMLELQRRVEEGEGRAEEVAGAVRAATRPLLQQMESQRAAHAAQLASWEALEAELTTKLSEAQSTAASSMEKERSMREQYAEVAANSTALQAQVTKLRAENSNLTTQLDLITTDLEALKESRTKENSQTASLRASLAEEASEARRERDSLRQQLDMERTALAAEKKRTAALQDQLRDRDRKLAHLLAGGGPQGPSGTSGGQGPAGGLVVAESSHTSTPRSSPTPSLSRISISGSLSESFCGSQWGDEVFESGWARGTSLYDSVRAGSTATVEALTSTLRQREGEIQHLHSEISRYEAQRESMSQELVAVTTQLEEQRALAGQLGELQEQYAEMEQRYNALLQMHGEKVEEVEELRLDLADVKEMYKAQIDELLQQ